MRIIGCDLHARQQTLAMLNTTTGEVVKATLRQEGNNVREFYSTAGACGCRRRLRALRDAAVGSASFPADWTVIEFADIAVTMPKTSLLPSWAKLAIANIKA